MNYEKIRLSAKDAIAYITQANPEKINALSGQMIREIIDAMTTVAETAHTRHVGLKRAGL